MCVDVSYRSNSKEKGIWSMTGKKGFHILR